MNSANFQPHTTESVDQMTAYKVTVLPDSDGHGCVHQSRGSGATVQQYRRPLAMRCAAQRASHLVGALSPFVGQGLAVTFVLTMGMGGVQGSVCGRPFFTHPAGFILAPCPASC